MTIGYYQNELRSLSGRALVNATVDVFNAGTLTPADLFSDEGGTVPLTSSPLAASVGGLLRPGKDVAANITFFADDAQEYDVRVVDPSGTFSFRARVGGTSGGANSFPIGSIARGAPVLSGVYGALDGWRTALKAVRAGTGNARAIAIGDSLTAGGGNAGSYVDRARDLWAANRLATSRLGMIFPSAEAHEQVALGAGWSISGVGDFGLANRGMAIGTIGAAGRLALGPAYCDTFELFFFGAGTGSFDVQVDAGSITTVNVTGTFWTQSVTVAAGAAGNHTLRIGTIVGTDAFIVGAEPRVGASGLYVGRAGVSTTTSGQWASAGSGAASAILVTDITQPDLLIIMLGTNDLNGQVALATYRANIDAIVARQLPYGSVLLVVPPRPLITWPPIVWESYVAQLVSIRDARGVAMLDYTQHFAGVNSDLFMEDDYHPNDAGRADMALALASALMP